MAFFRASREQRGPDPHTNIKIAIFSIGAVLALIGMFLKNNWFIYAAIGVLAVGVILRLVALRAERNEHGDFDESADDDHDASAPGEPRT